MKREVEQALGALNGLPVWGPCRALNMEMFEVGPRRRRLTRRGAEVEVGQYSLHVQCPWRLRAAGGPLIVGSEDRRYLPDGELVEPGYEGPTRCETRIAEWAQRVPAPQIERVEVDDIGGFRLLLTPAQILEAFPCASSTLEYSEAWRLIGWPAASQHFVIAGGRADVVGAEDRGDEH